MGRKHGSKFDRGRQQVSKRAREHDQLMIRFNRERDRDREVWR